MKKNKQKGYVLAVVMILCLVMTVTITTAFNLIFGYYTYAKKSVSELQDKPGFSTPIVQTSEPNTPQGVNYARN